MDTINSLFDADSVGSGGTTIILFDISASTKMEFEYSPLKSINKKMTEVLSGYIKRNSDQAFHIMPFSHDCLIVDDIHIEPHCETVNLYLSKLYKLGTSTATFKAIERVYNIYIKMLSKPTKVILYTDGETDYIDGCALAVKALSSIGIKMHIVSFLKTSDNLSKIEDMEGLSKIPGMDIVRSMLGYILNIEVYSSLYSQVPFQISYAAAVDRSNIEIFGYRFNPKMAVVSNLYYVVDTIVANKDKIAVDDNKNIIKHVCVNIGRVLALLYTNLPQHWDNPFVYKIASALSTTFELSQDIVMQKINYGFACAKANVQIVAQAINNDIITQKVKQTQFKDAITLLKNVGTTQGGSSITIPVNGVSILSDVNHTHNLKEYPKSADSAGNVYIGYEGDDQCSRIAIRTYFESIGFARAQTDPNVIFAIANVLLDMYVGGYNFDNKHVKVLRGLAITQMSLNLKKDSSSYYEVSCYDMWKAGNSTSIDVAIHTPHSSLYVDKRINMFDMEENMWWASMMFVVGLFENQMAKYQQLVEILNITDAQSFGDYLRKHYKSKNVYSLHDSTIKSCITLDSFDETDVLFTLAPHGTGNMRCSSNQVYTETELYEITNCVFCRQPLDIVTRVPYIVAPMPAKSDTAVFDVTQKMASMAVVGASTTAVVEASTTATAPVTKRLIRISLQGCVGSGKTTSSKILIKLFEDDGWDVYYISSDMWSIKKLSNPSINPMHMNMETLKKALSSVKSKVVIIADLCHEKGVEDKLFSVDVRAFVSYKFIPNYYKDETDMNAYADWCYANLTKRTVPSEDYYLNMCESDEICIKVWNMKMKGIAKMVFGNIWTDRVYNPNNAALYQKFLDAKGPIEQQVIKFAKTAI